MSFTAHILAEVCTQNFKLSNLAPHDGKANPAYHIQHYETWMMMQSIVSGAMCQYFSLNPAGQDGSLRYVYGPKEDQDVLAVN